MSYFEGRNSAKAPIDITVPLAVLVSLAEGEGHSYQVALSLPPSVGIDPAPVPVRYSPAFLCIDRDFVAHRGQLDPSLFLFEEAAHIAYVRPLAGAMTGAEIVAEVSATYLPHPSTP